MKPPRGGRRLPLWRRTPVAKSDIGGSADPRAGRCGTASARHPQASVEAVPRREPLGGWAHQHGSGGGQSKRRRLPLSD